MAGRAAAKRAQPVASQQVAALADLPAGPALATALAGIDLDRLTGFESVLVLKAEQRQANHARGRVYQAAVQVLRHRGPGNQILPDWHSDELVRTSDVRAALLLTRHAAKDFCTLVRDLAVRLPAVLAAMVAGVLDEARARIFSTWTADLPDRHAAVLVQRLLPVAARLTTSELVAALRKGAIELDPEWARRRYERAVGQRRFEARLRTDGTADVIAHNVSAGRAAIVGARIDTLAHRLHQAGYPGNLDRLRADLVMDKLGGLYEGFTDDDIFDLLMFTLTDEYAEATREDADSTVEQETDAGDAQPEPEVEPDVPDSTVDDEAGRGDEPEEHAVDGTDPSTVDGSDGEPDGGTPTPEDPPPTPPASADTEPQPEQAPSAAGRRSGQLRLWIGLPTVAGLDRRPAELLGLGWIHAELARDLAAAPGASWWYVLTDTTGAQRQVGPIQKRPDQRQSPDPKVRIEVWLHLTRDELTALVHDPPPGWADLITDLHQHVAHSHGGPPNGDPTRRLPGDQLRRWLAIRDRRCTFPGCRVPAHRSHMDHTVEHGHGGPTLDHNLAAACPGDHQLRHEGGWSVHQPTPGTVIWTSPLGHTYQRLPEQTLPPMDQPVGHDEDQDPDDGGEAYTPFDTCIDVIAAPERKPPPPPRPTPPPDDNEVPPF